MKTFEQFLKESEALPATSPAVEETPVPKQTPPSGAVATGGLCSPPLERGK